MRITNLNQLKDGMKVRIFLDGKEEAGIGEVETVGNSYWTTLQKSSPHPSARDRNGTYFLGDKKSGRLNEAIEIETTEKTRELSEQSEQEAMKELIKAIEDSTKILEENRLKCEAIRKEIAPLLKDSKEEVSGGQNGISTSTNKIADATTSVIYEDRDGERKPMNPQSGYGTWTSNKVEEEDELSDSDIQILLLTIRNNFHQDWADSLVSKLSKLLEKRK